MLNARLAAIGLLVLAVSVGCNRSSSPTTPDAGGPMAMDMTGPHAAGKKVFAASCARCHSVGEQSGPGGPGGPGPGRPPGGPGGGPGGPGGGPGGPGGGPGGFGRGPNLAKVGADPTHTVKWIMDYVRNPKSIKPESRMPPLEGKINDDDLKAVAEYLASLK